MLAVAIFAATRGDIQAGQGLAGARHAGDETDGLSAADFARLDRPTDGVLGAGQVDGIRVTARDVLDSMPGVERRRRLDNGRRRPIARGFPVSDAEPRRAVMGGDHPHDLAEVLGTEQKGLGDKVEGQFELHVPRYLSQGRHQDRKDRQVVAAFVEVLQIQRIVLDLKDGGGVEMRLADLEFDDEDGFADDHDDVGALAHARDGEFEVEGEGGDIGQGVTHDDDLLKPRRLVARLDIEMMPAR